METVFTIILFTRKQIDSLYLSPGPFSLLNEVGSFLNKSGKKGGKKYIPKPHVWERAEQLAGFTGSYAEWRGKGWREKKYHNIERDNSTKIQLLNPL